MHLFNLYLVSNLETVLLNVVYMTIFYDSLASHWTVSGWIVREKICRILPSELVAKLA